MSADLKVLALQNRLKAISLDSEEYAERFAVYHDFKVKLDSFIHEKRERTTLDLKQTILVGSMADGTYVGMPVFDLLLPAAMTGLRISEPVQQYVEVTMLKDLASKREFLNGSNLVGSIVGEHIVDIAGKAADYFKGIPGSFPKHHIVLSRSTYFPDTPILVAQFIDRRINEITLEVHVIPILQAASDGVTSQLIPSGSGDWRVCFFVKERDLIGAWNKSTSPGCRVACVKLLKALLINRYPELPRCIGKYIVLRELRDTKNNENEWGSHQLAKRFFSLVEMVKHGVEKGELYHFFHLFMGGGGNLLDGLAPDRRSAVLKRLTDDTKSSESLVQNVSVALCLKV